MAAFAREASGPFALPLRGRLESGFGYRWGRLHAGIDISVLDTDRVGAALAGTVAKVGYQDRYAGYGNIVLLRHGDGFATLYAHLARVDVKVGERVDRRELLGRAGCTGSCTGQHLHFEVRILGKPVRPDAVPEARRRLAKIALRGAVVLCGIMGSQRCRPVVAPTRLAV